MNQMNVRALAAMCLLFIVLLAGCSSRTSSGNNHGADTTAVVTPAPAPATPAPDTTPASPSTAPVTNPPTGTAGKPVPGNSGIIGEVRQAPMTRGLPEGEQDYALLSNATVVVEDMMEKVVATTTSDANGKFYLELPSGWYLLIPQPFPDRDYPHPPVSEQVFVPVNGTASVTFTFNTGIK